MIERDVCRAVLRTPIGEVLLMQVREPTTGWTAWITPGGGARPGELPEEILRRELFEETGLREFELGPQIWHRDHTATWEGRLIRQVEAFYLVEIHRFAPTIEHLPESTESRAFRRFHWWPVEEIETSEERFVPRRLGGLLRDLLESGIPSEPFDAGV